MIKCDVYSFNDSIVTSGLETSHTSTYVLGYGQTVCVIVRVQNGSIRGKPKRTFQVNSSESAIRFYLGTADLTGV